MKRKILIISAVMGITGAVAWNVNYGSQNEEISVFSLANIEALSDPENGSACKWSQVSCPGLFGGTREVCLDDGDGNTCICGSTTRPC